MGVVVYAWLAFRVLTFTNKISKQPEPVLRENGRILLV